jgi:flagellar biosynthesis/type III secretory pathway protein FliH
MPFMTSVERIGFERGRAQGLQEGRQEGIQQGREEGRREALLKGIELVLKLKFGAAGLQLMPDLRNQADLAVLQKVFDAIEPAAAPDDLRRLLP